jgi:tetratricopeptide (TPR) repeat protein
VRSVPRQKSDHVDSAAALAARLREARELTGLSQRALARGICTPAYISRLEKGERIPSLQLLRRLADRLGANADELASGSRPVDDPLRDAELALRLGSNAEAEQAFHAALRQEDRTLRLRALRGLGELAFDRGEHRQAIELLETAGAEASDPLAVAEPLGRAYALAGELESAIAVFERALEAARERDDRMETLRFAVLLANALIDANRFGRAAELLGDTIAATAESHDPLILARLWWSQSRLHEKQNDPDTAARYARRAVAALELTEHTTYTARAHQLLAHIELDLGHAADALDILAKGYPLIERSGNRYDKGMFRLEQARAYAQLGLSEEAAAVAMEASTLFTDASPGDAARAYALVADVFVDLDDPARALELYELAVELRPSDDRVRRDIAARRAELLEQEGRKDEALELLKQAMRAPSESESLTGD